MQLRGPFVEALRRMLPPLPLQHHALQEERIVALRLEDRGSLLGKLRGEGRVGLDLVVGVVAGLLRGAIRLGGVCEVARAVQGATEVELYDGVIRIAERDWLERMRGRLRWLRQSQANRFDVR